MSVMIEVWEGYLLCVAAIIVANFEDVCRTKLLGITNGHTGLTRNHGGFAVYAKSVCVIMHNAFIIVR